MKSLDNMKAPNARYFAVMRTMASLALGCSLSACKIQQPKDIRLAPPKDPGTTLSPAAPNSGEDLGYRWDVATSSCKNTQGLTGLNPGYLGECSLHKSRNFSQQTLSGNSFKASSLISVAFHMAELGRADFSYARSQGTHFNRAHLEGANFAKSAHAQSVFTQAALTDASFEDASLPGAVMLQVEAASPATNFSGADLSNANFANARLTEARFREARLVYANLIGADLARADLTDALLTGASFNTATKLPFSKEEALRRGMRFLQ